MPSQNSPRFAVFCLFGLAAIGIAQPTDLPSPKEHFGFELGTDSRLVGWSELVAYYKLLDRASPRIDLEVLGTSTLGREMILLTVSRLDGPRRAEAKRLQRDLARGQVEESAWTKVLAEQPVVVYIQATLHSTEIAASLLFPELLHYWATTDDAKVLRLLDSLIILIVPSANPDGIDLVHQWYEKTLGTPWEGSSPPELYQTYAGHDNNRDWSMLSLRETQLLTRVLYREWYPEIVLDIHQMGGTGARMFVPPFSDPINENLPPLLSRQMDLVGTHMAWALTMRGLKGVVQDTTFDNYWTGGARNVPVRHNMIGILTETAAARLASPRFVDYSDLKGQGQGLPEYKAQGNFPEPWLGGWWRLRDILTYQRVSTEALLDLAARYRETFVLNYHELARTAVARGRSEAPYGWVIPSGQPDFGTVARLVNNLVESGVEVQRMEAPFEASGLKHPAGSFLISAAQPYRAYAKDVLESQIYPEIKTSTSGEVLRPYDASAWSLPLQFGVTVTPLASPFEQQPQGALIREALRSESVFEPQNAAGSFAVESSANHAFTLVQRALSEGGTVTRTRADQGGVFLLERLSKEKLSALGEGFGLRFSAVPEEARLSAKNLTMARVAILETHPESMDGGWTQLVLEEHGFAPKKLSSTELRSGRIRERCDVLILCDISSNRLKDGAGPGDLPLQYQGGLGKDGASALRSFVRSGGQLLCFGSSIRYANEIFDLGVSGALEGASAEARAKFSCPGSLLRAEIAGETLQGPETSRLLAGFDRSQDLVLFVDNADAFTISKSQSSIERVLTFPENPLVAGYLAGGDTLAGTCALGVAREGEGRILLYAFRPQHRSQTLGTFRLIFNALLLGW